MKEISSSLILNFFPVSSQILENITSSSSSSSTPVHIATSRYSVFVSWSFTSTKSQLQNVFFPDVEGFQSSLCSLVLILVGIDCCSVFLGFFVCSWDVKLISGSSSESLAPYISSTRRAYTLLKTLFSWTVLRFEKFPFSCWVITSLKSSFFFIVSLSPALTAVISEFTLVLGVLIGGFLIRCICLL